MHDNDVLVTGSDEALVLPLWVAQALPNLNIHQIRLIVSFSLAAYRRGGVGVSVLTGELAIGSHLSPEQTLAVLDEMQDAGLVERVEPEQWALVWKLEPRAVDQD